MKSPANKNDGAGPFSAVFPVAAGVFCTLLIGSTGFIKYRIDHSLLSDQGQDSTSLWSLLLMIVAWAGLILAAALAVGLYVTLRNRDAAPLGALAQSVENISRGDMDLPVWGIERQDAIGELARKIDAARYRFSQLPDVSLVGEQPPVRLRFEGEARSLFAAMMEHMAGTYDKARAEASGFSDSAREHREILATLSQTLDDSIRQTRQHSAASDKAVGDLTQRLSGSIRRLVETQEKITAQISAVAPFMQERAKNMAEITQTAGTEVAKILQSLLQTEREARSGAAQSQQTIQQLSASANQLGERLFAAVNLVQASGKVLNETIESAKTGLASAVEKIGSSENNLDQLAARTRAVLDSSEKAILAEMDNRWNKSLAQIENMHDRLAQLVIRQNDQMDIRLAAMDRKLGASSSTAPISTEQAAIMNEIVLTLAKVNDHVTQLDGAFQEAERRKA